MVNKLKVYGQRYSLQIGHRGESAAREFVIDITPWLDEWPQGMAVVLVKRPCDKQYYMARNIVQNTAEKTLTWKPDASDTEFVAIDPPVLVQVVCSDGNTVLAKTPVWLCRVMPSLDGTEMAPPASEMPWVSSVLEAAVEARQSSNSAAQSANAAASSAAQASQAESRAQSYAQSAGTSASQAGTSATNAGNAAARAASAAENAEAAALSADEDADRAETAATRAEERSEQTIEAAEEVASASAAIISAEGVVRDLVAQAGQHKEAAAKSANSAAVAAEQALNAAQNVQNHIDDAEAYAIRSETAAAYSEAAKQDAETAARDAESALASAEDYADRTIEAASMIEDDIAYIETAAGVVEDLTKQAAFHEAAALEYSESSAASARHSRWWWEKIVKFGTGHVLEEIQSDWLDNDEQSSLYVRHRTHYIVRDAGTYNLFAPIASNDGRQDDLEPLPEGYGEDVQPEEWTIQYDTQVNDLWKANHAVLILYELKTEEDPLNPYEETYTVIWDGVTTTGLSVEDGKITGDGFVLEYLEETIDGVTAYRIQPYAETQGEHTFSLYAVCGERVIRIDEKYLPVNPHFDGEVTALRFRTNSGCVLPAWWVRDAQGAAAIRCVKGSGE